MPLALLALAIATFGAGTAEFVMIGLLPEAASDMGVSISQAGGYVSFYSLGVVIGAPLLTVAGMRVRRKTILLAMTGLFISGNIASALAPNHELLLAARFSSGLPHGVFFGIGAVVAAGLVQPQKRGRALSVVLVGVPMANIVGSPLGTLLGQTVGWRWTFIVVAGIGLLGLVFLAVLLPVQPGPVRGSVRGELGLFKRPQVWLAYTVVVFGFAGTSSFYTYIQPLVTQVSGYTPTAATALLALAGAGMTVGTMLGGRLADWPVRTICGALLTLSLSLAMILFTAQNTVLVAANVFLTGVAGMAAIPSVQARILDHGRDAPELGSASVQSAFNIANSLGASLGGMVIAAGFGLTSPSWLGALLALTGACFGLLSGWLDRGSGSWQVASSAPSWKSVKSEALSSRAEPHSGSAGRPDRPALRRVGHLAGPVSGRGARFAVGPAQQRAQTAHRELVLGRDDQNLGVGGHRVAQQRVVGTRGGRVGGAQVLQLGAAHTELVGTVTDPYLTFAVRPAGPYHQRVQPVLACRLHQGGHTLRDAAAGRAGGGRPGRVRGPQLGEGLGGVPPRVLLPDPFGLPVQQFGGRAGGPPAVRGLHGQLTQLLGQLVVHGAPLARIAAEQQHVGAALREAGRDGFGDHARVALPGVLHPELEVLLGELPVGGAVHRPLLTARLAGGTGAVRVRQLEVGARTVDAGRQAQRVLAQELR